MYQNMSSLLILTPIWKDKLDYNELNNLQISLSFNSEFDHAFFHGKNLDLSFYKLNFPESKYYSFESFEFDTIERYNYLLQSYLFYSSFIDFDYILILQLDALLVKNVSPLLLLNFDYIGAPWDNGYKVPSLLFQIKIFSLILKKVGFYKKCYVGNGGLSLRKVKIFVKLTHKYKPIKWLNEDFKFALLIKNNFLTAPNYTESKLFFFEKINTDVNELPDVYGFHAIQKYYPSLYSRLISLYKII